MIWAAVVLGSLGTFATKLAGYFIPDHVLNRPFLRRLAGYLPIAMLAALVAVQTFAEGQSLVIDARFIGLVAAMVALALRAPFLVVVLVAAVTAAVLRGIGVAA